jgi:GntR family galactonate operon transcriptional repressor
MSDQAVGTEPRPGIVTGSAPRLPPARLGVAVVADLVSAIVTGELSPGDVLPPEGVLSSNFGVSRTVIR